jgi:polyhydroxyalkanoate synthase
VAATAASAASAAGAATAARAAGALTSLPSAVGADRAALAAVEAFLPPNIEGKAPKFTPRTSFPGTVDPARLAQALGEAIGRTLVQPTTYTGLLGRHAQGVGQALFATAGRLVGHKPDGPVSPAPRDTRFASDTWQNNPLFFGLMQAYLLHRDLLSEFVAAADLPLEHQAKAEMAAGLLGDAMAPTNFLLGNPEALRKALDSKGGSLVKGIRNFLHDVIYNEGWPSQVDVRPFTVGKNTACSPGKVVFQNELMELIQYSPTTEQVHEIPMLLSPPWINKYYIFDMAPGKSLVEWAVSHGLTTFAISYRNPDGSQRDLSFEDYLLHGPRMAIDVIRSITSAPKVNMLSACIGGTLTTAMLAHLQATGEPDLVNSSTVLNCLVDHEDAGTLSAVYADEGTISGIEEKMESDGYLDAADMAHTFDLLRANELVFRYVASNWLMGTPPPAFDLLAWNGDSTRMPAAMHSFYLRKCWLENALAKDEMVLDGHQLKVSDIETDTYIVAAVDDHIVPWKSSYKTTGLIKGESRFVLSSSGHIAGIINPPSPKARLWTNETLSADPDEWLAGAEKSERSWWQDWAEWIAPRSGPLGSPPPMGSDAYPLLGPAPGTFVKVRSH